MVRNGRQYGIWIHTSGRGRIRQNEICHNQFAGIEIMSGGAPLVRRNASHHNPWGILLREQGRGTIEDNDLFRNIEAGVGCRHRDSTPTVRANRCYGNDE